MKKSQQLLVRITTDLEGRALKVERKTGIKPTEMCRVGLVEVLNRLEGGMPLIMTVSADDLRAHAEVIALGLNPATVLRDAVAAHLTPPPSA